MTVRWLALANRSVCVRRWRADVHHWQLLAIVGQLLVNDGKFLLSSSALFQLSFKARAQAVRRGAAGGGEAAQVAGEGGRAAGGAARQRRGGWGGDADREATIQV